MPRTGLVRADRFGGHASVAVDGGCTALPALGAQDLGMRASDSLTGGAPRRGMTDSPTPTSPSGAERPQALYRRLRAQTFGEMVGQDADRRDAAQRRPPGPRSPTAYLFVGPRGTGKTSTARILAKAVNCTDLRDGEPCDACPSCVAIREGRALDVIELDAASNNRSTTCASSCRASTPRAADLRRKVFIIDEVQRIKEGWDVLLKTLEEPPDGRPLHLLHHRPEPDPPGRRLAAAALHLPAAAGAEIEGKLRRILEAEGRTVEPEAVALIARLAGGGMRDAESMLDQVLVSSADPITRDIRRGPARPGRRAPASTASSTPSSAATSLAGIRLLDALEAEGRDLVAFSEQLVTRLRELLVARLSSAAARPSARGRGPGRAPRGA